MDLLHIEECFFFFFIFSGLWIVLVFVFRNLRKLKTFILWKKVHVDTSLQKLVYRFKGITDALEHGLQVKTP